MSVLDRRRRSVGAVHGDGEETGRQQRLGTLAGLAAYSLWGVFPLVFHELEGVGALEILMHRVVWSFVVVLAVLAVRRKGAWVRPLLADRRRVALLAAAGTLVATNWLVYIWAVNEDRVIEAALGYYINPLITVALGVVVLREHLRRAQVVALGFGAAAVAVLTIAYGRLPWIALVLAASFAGYGYLKKSVGVGAAESLAVETAVLLPIALVGLVVLEVGGDAGFLHGSGGRDALLVSLGVVTAVPLLLFGTAARRIPLSLLGLLQYLTPTLQLLCGVVVLDEDLPPERLVGFVLVWIALLLLAVDAFRGRAGRGVAAAVDPHPAAEPV
ncbi:MAG: EamA family transporter RarD [Acidimicrobiia bacterium]|nr:EamA family transporter RarD [Acidimicrobiia bacterium]